MTQATLGTRHRTEGPIKNEQLNDAVNIGNKTQNEDKQNKQTHNRKLKRRTPPRHDCHDIAEVMVTLVLNTITLTFIP
jgi:hypothetical protein